MTYSTTAIEPPLILVIDVGSSSTRSMLLDRAARTVPGSMARLRYEPELSASGAAEEDSAAALERIYTCIDATLAQVGSLADQIVAVATATFAPTLVGLDSAGRAVTPLLLYADTRSSADAAALRAELDEPALLDRTGCPLRAAYHPARLRWLLRTRPELTGQVARWCSLGDLLALRLFGQARLSLSLASWTGLLNRHTLRWDHALLETLNVDTGQLAELVDIDTPLGTLRDSFAQRWPALATLPWLPAIGDGAAANLGSGCVAPGHVALSIGTSAALRVVRPNVDTVPMGLWCYRVDRRRALLGGATSEGGNVLAWLRGVLQLADDHTLMRAVDEIAPDSHGLTLLPFIAGERSPGWAGDVRASIVGLGLSTTPEQILRAGLEAVAYRLALIDRLLPNDAARSYMASGGALAAAPGWGQIIADVFGAPLAISAVDEPTSRGCGLLALAALGLLPDLAALPAAHSNIFTPNPAHHTLYAEAIQRQVELYGRLIG